MFVFALREREKNSSKRGRGVERLAEFFGDSGWVYFKVRGKAWRSEASF